jgi:hypothetical protein
MASAHVQSSRSRLAHIQVVVAVVIAAASALPRIRPWEYFNELVGGPEKAYLSFVDEGVDMGQRRLDFVRYYREHLEPAGEVPYLLYPMAPSEQKRRGVRTLGEWRTDSQEDIQWPDVSGIFFLSAVQINRNRRYQALAACRQLDASETCSSTAGRFTCPGYVRGSYFFALPGFSPPEPDLDNAELREVLTINPKSFGALLQLGNLMSRRSERVEAMRFYEHAREQLGNEEQAMRAVLTQQIERLSSNEPLERIPAVRGTREE